MYTGNPYSTLGACKQVTLAVHLEQVHMQSLQHTWSMHTGNPCSTLGASTQVILAVHMENVHR